MSHKLADEFYWNDNAPQQGEAPAAEQYKQIAGWALKARGKNPTVFDELTEWLLDDTQWGSDKLAENEQLLVQGVLGRFKAQNARLRAQLSQLQLSGVVNPAVFQALDRFDAELAGQVEDEALREAVTRMFADFTAMGKRGLREQIAGNVTGPFGTKGVDYVGYINYLKDCDAGVQWALFMPDMVKQQQKGFKVESFEYKQMPALRFIGREGEDLADVETRKALFKTLDALDEHKSGLDFDVLFMHHYGMATDIGPWHGFWGRFFKAGTPVPKGLSHFDLVPQSDGKAGLPFISQFAYAAFSGDMDAMHRREGYDSDAMYDITRNIMLGQGVNIPYPDKYWTAEVFPNGCDQHSTAYMFSAEL